MSARHLNSDKIPKLEATANTSNCGYIDGRAQACAIPPGGREHAKPWYSSKVYIYFVHIAGLPCIWFRGNGVTVAIRTWISVTEVAEVLPKVLLCPASFLVLLAFLQMLETSACAGDAWLKDFYVTKPSYLQAMLVYSKTKLVHSDLWMPLNSSSFLWLHF